MKNFALIGAAGYVAPRHMKAIKDTGNRLVAAMDPNDSVGVIDSYFPEADFFVEFERFERHTEKLRRENSPHAVEYVSVCSPNFLHDAHIRFALRSNAHAICEKPVVLNPWNIDALQRIEADTGKRVYTILQLRVHPAVLALKEKVAKAAVDKVFIVDLTYITSRGKWYQYSWKGDEKKSGGLAMNIGVHLFDMLHFIFGDIKESILHYKDAHKAAGYQEYARAQVRWFLSIDAADLPASVARKGQTTLRSITVDDEEILFSEGFTDLHTRLYEDIFDGRGFGLEVSRTSIETVAAIRTSNPQGIRGNYHPFLRQ